jgi:hypothetical protein
VEVNKEMIKTDEGSRELWDGLPIPFHPHLKTKYIHTEINGNEVTIVMEAVPR